MAGFTEGYLQEVISRYDGPALIERLHVLTKLGGETSGRAAAAALKHLGRANQYSPYVDSFISQLEELPDAEDVQRFRNPQWVQSLQNRKQNRLKDLGADNLYHEADVSKNIEVAQIYTYNKQYTEAQGVLSSSTLGSLTCQLAEQSAQVGILQGNLNLTLNQDKRIEAFISTSLSSELYLKRLTDREIVSYWRVKFLILYAEFLRQNYEEAAKSIYELIRLPALQTASGKNVSAVDILNDSNFNSFIHKDEIILISVISILLTRKASELNDILAEQEFITLVGNRLAEFRPLLVSLNSAKFEELFSALDVYDQRLALDVFICKSWPRVRLAFREKGYQLYLSLIVRAQSSHLSQKLAIPNDQLVKEMKRYIENKNLEFSYDPESDIFEQKKVNKREVFVEKLRVLSEESDVIEGLLRERIDKLAKTHVGA